MTAMAISCSAGAITSLQKWQLKRYHVFRYGALVVFIVILSVPACFKGLLSKLAMMNGVDEEQKHPTTAETNVQRPANNLSMLKEVPVIGYRYENVTKDCRVFETALAQLTQVLHDDPENHAVRPWTYTSNNNNIDTPQDTTEHYTFPGLSSQLLRDAFADRRMALIGDSTLFYMMRWLQTLVSIKSPLVQDSLQTMTMAQANLEINPLINVRDQLSWSDNSPPFVHKDFIDEEGMGNKGKTHANIQQQQHSYDIVWDGFRGLDDPSGESFGALWERVRRWQPNIMVVNSGLHWLHFQGAGRDSPLAHVRLWTTYETWLEEVIQLANDCGTSLLLFKTTNRICEEKYVGVYSDTVTAITKERQGKASLPTFVNRCVQELQDLQNQEPRGANGSDKSPKALSKEDIENYCKDGTFDEVGVQNLNSRLFHFVRGMQSTKATGTSNVTISIFNDHDVMSCNYTKITDGRHYHPLNLMRIRLLANMVQAQYCKEC